MNKIAIFLVLSLILISGCNISGFSIPELKKCSSIFDCGENQYCQADVHMCKEIVNECETDEGCGGYETCEIREISTGFGCKIDEECPKFYHNVCELTSYTIKYCEEDYDCIWAFNPNECCSCPMVYNRNILKTEFKELVIYEKDKNYPEIDCKGVSCFPCAPITELKCINNQCIKDIEKIIEKEDCAKEGEIFHPFHTSETPEKCCSGLTEWIAGMDTRISIENECYVTKLVAGAPFGICINCGNGVCEKREDFCNCPQDCFGGENSDYKSIKEFCEQRWAQFEDFCETEPFIENFPICDLCK